MRSSTDRRDPANTSQADNGGWSSADEVVLRYVGLTPIATCHWQWVGNVLAAQGAEDAWETLGLSWGARWAGGSVLFGLMTWPTLLAELRGAAVSIHTFDGPADARDAELELSRRGQAFIAEIDEYHLLAPGRARDHVVHAVLVAERTRSRVRVVDATLGPQVIELSTASWERTRVSPCRGRVESHKLYAVGTEAGTDPAPAAVLDAVRRSHATTHAHSHELLERYVAWAEAGDAPIDVCRAAGERYQAARLYEHLADRGIPAAAHPARLLDRLAGDWYLVHMLTSHERSLEPRARRRILRLLTQLLEDEAAATEAVLE